MFKTVSDWVLAVVVFEDGTSVVKEMRTADGEWSLSRTYGVKEVTHWMPMPETVKEVV
jgi:hypothetical protein